MWVKISGLHEPIGHEGVQEPPSGCKWNSTGCVEDYISRAEVWESLVKAGRARPTRGRIRTDTDKGFGPGLQCTVRPGVLFFPLGPSVLEPDFHLGLGQTQGQGQI